MGIHRKSYDVLPATGPPRFLPLGVVAKGRRTGRGRVDPAEEQGGRKRNRVIKRRRRLSLPAIPSNQGIHRSPFDESARPPRKNMNGRGKKRQPGDRYDCYTILGPGDELTDTPPCNKLLSLLGFAVVESFLLRIVKFMLRLWPMYFILLTGSTNRWEFSFESEMCFVCINFTREYVSAMFITMAAYVPRFEYFGLFHNIHCCHRYSLLREIYGSMVVYFF